MNPRVRQAILLCSALWLAAGFAAGWAAAELRRSLAEPREGGNASVEKLAELYHLDRRQQELLLTVWEGNRRKVEILEARKGGLSPEARRIIEEEIKKIPAEMDFIIQNAILSEAQLAEYRRQLGREGDGKE